MVPISLHHFKVREEIKQPLRHSSPQQSQRHANLLLYLTPQVLRQEVKVLKSKEDNNLH
eukprot:gene5517-7040_t